jgi:N-methylhydantoinase A
VGPRSAGADPGPACYGRGGTEPTVTDANLLLGYLPPDRPLAAEVMLNRELAFRAIEALAGSLELDPIACAEGIVRVANAEMLRALRVVTVERGIDPRRYALLAFGGAGPLHAAAIAHELGIDHILCPSASGVLAALGLVVSPRRRDAQRTLLLGGRDFTREQVGAAVKELAQRAREALADKDADITTTYELRYRGQAFELAVTAGSDANPEELRTAFASAHEDRYGYSDPSQEIELVTVRVSATVPGATVELGGGSPAAGPPPRVGRRTAVLDGRELELETIDGLPHAGSTIAGPAVVELPESTVLIPPGWDGEVDRTHTLHLRRR